VISQSFSFSCQGLTTCETWKFSLQFEGDEGLLSPTVSDLQDWAALCFLFSDVRCFGATSTGKETCMDGVREGSSKALYKDNG
jgi:hypothetical protein